MDKAVAKTTSGDTDTTMVVVGIIATGLVCLTLGTFLIGPAVQKAREKKKLAKAKKGTPKTSEPNKKA